MDDNKVTPEFINDFTIKAVEFHKKTVEMTGAFYIDQIAQLSVFHTQMYNRLIENDVPLLYTQWKVMTEMFRGLMNAWVSTINNSFIVHCTEIDYLRTLCIRRLTEEECPVTKFVEECRENEDMQRKIAEIEQRMWEIHEKASNFEEAKRMESRVVLKDHTVARHEWLKYMFENHIQDEAALDAAIIMDDAFSGENHVDNFYQRVRDRKKEFLDYLEVKQRQFTDIFEISAESCRKDIDRCIETKCPESSEFIREFKNSANSQIEHFENAARKYLESVKSIAERPLLVRKKLTFPNVEAVFLDEMKENLKILLIRLKGVVNVKGMELSKYRTDKREEVAKINMADIAEQEQAQLRNDSTLAPNINIDLSKYSITKRLISRGGEGSVFRFDIPGNLLNINQGVGFGLVRVAAKMFTAGGTNEVLSLCQLYHTNIALFLGTGIMDAERYLLTEYYPRSLSEEIEACRKKNKYLKLPKFTKWANELAHALRYVHNNGRIHGDVKPRNILLNNKDTLKLADFGLSSTGVSNGPTANRGTARYMSPEQHAGKDLDTERCKKCDIWAYGIVLWEMISCREPFSDVEEHRIPLVIGAKTESSHPPLPGLCSGESLGNLLRSCWARESIYRPSMYDISVNILPDIISEFNEEFPNDRMWSDECQKWADAQ